MFLPHSEQHADRTEWSGYTSADVLEAWCNVSWLKSDFKWSNGTAWIHYITVLLLRNITVLMDSMLNWEINIRMPNTRIFLFCNAAEAHYSTSCSVMYSNTWHRDNTSLCTMQTGHANTVCTVCCVSGKSSDKYLKLTQMCVWEATALRRHSSGWLLRRPNAWVSQKRKEGATWQDWTRRLSSNRAPWMGEIRMPVFCSAFHQVTFICFIYIFKDWKRFSIYLNHCFTQKILNMWKWDDWEC